MPGCHRCENLPAALPREGNLYIAPPLAHTQATLRRFLQEAAIEYSEPYPSILAVRLNEGTLLRVTAGLRAALSQAELADSKSLLLPEGVVPSLPDLMQMQPLSILCSQVQGEWLLDMVHDERFVTHFQPIVHSSRPEEVYAYECLLRGRAEDGTLVYPDRIFNAALSADILFQVDRAARMTAVRNAAVHSIGSNIFINFNPSSIYDPAFCLRTTIKGIEEAGIKPERIVFEVVESTQAGDVEHLERILGFYRNKGFRVALDDLGAGYSSLNLLTRIKPDFVKLDIQLIRDVDTDPYKAQVAAKLLELANGLDIQTVAEGIETEGEWHWARDHGATYLQGYLFAKPACPPPLSSFAARLPILAVA